MNAGKGFRKAPGNLLRATVTASGAAAGLLVTAMRAGPAMAAVDSGAQPGTGLSESPTATQDTPGIWPLSGPNALSARVSGSLVGQELILAAALIAVAGTALTVSNGRHRAGGRRGATHPTHAGTPGHRGVGRISIFGPKRPAGPDDPWTDNDPWMALPDLPWPGGGPSQNASPPQNARSPREAGLPRGARPPQNARLPQDPRPLLHADDYPSWPGPPGPFALHPDHPSWPGRPDPRWDDTEAALRADNDYPSWPERTAPLRLPDRPAPPRHERPAPPRQDSPAPPRPVRPVSPQPARQAPPGPGGRTPPWPDAGPPAPDRGQRFQAAPTAPVLPARARSDLAPRAYPPPPQPVIRGRVAEVIDRTRPPAPPARPQP